MKSTIDQLAQRLGAELGAAAVVTEPSVLASHVVDGMQPALVCSPATAEQIAAALRVCVETEAAVVPWGRGKAMGVGETSIILVGAAISNAVFDATGIKLREIPYTPEKVKAAFATRT